LFLFRRTAHYYSFKDAKDIAWYYPDPKEKAAEIKGFVAFNVSKFPGELELSPSLSRPSISLDESSELTSSSRFRSCVSGDLVVEELVEGKWGRVTRDEKEEDGELDEEEEDEEDERKK